MKIAMITSESLPFSKTGGLGDVVFPLSKALAELGHDLKLFIPALKNNISEATKLVGTIKDPQGYDAKLYQYQPLDELSNFKIYLVQEPTLISQNNVYGEKNQPYHFNASRFALFSRLSLQVMITQKWEPNIINCHDWATALVPAYIKNQPFSNFFKNTKSVFTIHNLGYQGIFWLRAFHSTLLPANAICYNDKKKSQINFMASALTYADQITTVSPTYAKEILIKENSKELAPLLCKHEDKIVGILNGIDNQKWNPETDPYIAKNYSAKKLDGKERCKKELLKEVGLKDFNRPLVVMISRLANQKGIEVLFGRENAIEQIVQNLNINMIVVGTGESWCENRLTELTKKYTNFKGIKDFSEELSHKVEAAGDFFLMPSIYEPCGLNQLYSSRYGTIPIVRNTGGLADTVTPLKTLNYANVNEIDATGYNFDDLTASAVYNTLAWAIEVKKTHPQIHKKMIQNAMERDYSWSKSASKYQSIYQQIM